MCSITSNNTRIMLNLSLVHLVHTSIISNGSSPQTSAKKLITPAIPCSIRYSLELTDSAVPPITSDTTPASILSVNFWLASTSAELKRTDIPTSNEGIINIADV